MPIKPAKIDSVIDGDTLKIQKGHRILPVRCRFIDCPEPDSKWGREAKAFLESAIDGRTVAIEEWGRDRYGRILADWYREGEQGRENLQVAIVDAGLATDLTPLCRHTLTLRSLNLYVDIIKSQYVAKREGMGFWGDPNFVL